MFGDSGFLDCTAGFIFGCADDLVDLVLESVLQRANTFLEVYTVLDQILHELCVEVADIGLSMFGTADDGQVAQSQSLKV